MGEKSKWFRPRATGLPEIQPILIESALSGDQTCALSQTLLSKFGASAKPYVFFVSLTSMRADARLARNLKVTIRQLLLDDDRLFDLDECDVLRRLDTAGLSLDDKQTAQALLNVYERYQLMQVLRPLFQHARTRV